MEKSANRPCARASYTSRVTTPRTRRKSEPHVDEALDAALDAAAEGPWLTAEEVFEALGIERKEPREPIVITEFDRWVGANQPSSELEYSKGFWDYVEFVQTIQRKLSISDVAVVGHHVIRTPPPEENLPMPVALLVARGTEVALRMDFGADQRFPFEWTLSVKRSTPYRGPTFKLFDPNVDLRRKHMQGLEPHHAFGPYSANQSEFSCDVTDEWDVMMLLRLLFDEG